MGFGIASNDGRWWREQQSEILDEVERKRRSNLPVCWAEGGRDLERVQIQEEWASWGFGRRETWMEKSRPLWQSRKVRNS